MKKLTLLLLLMVSTNVMAEWYLVGKYQNNDSSYIDINSVNRIDNISNVWELILYRKQEISGTTGRSFQSSKGLISIDCTEEKVNLLEFFVYDSTDGTGSIVNDPFKESLPTKKIYVVPGTMYHKIMKIVCDKKWTRVDGNDVVGLTSYVDFGSIKKKGNKVNLWNLIDFKTIQKFKNYRYLSQLGRYEYDCEEKTLQILDFYLYSENMKQSDIVYRETNMKVESESIVPESVNETLLIIVCGKK